MNKTIVERFLIGGNNIRPSIPSPALQKAFGNEIQIDVINQTLYVPTENGITKATKGDTIICFSNGTFDVEKGAKK